MAKLIFSAITSLDDEWEQLVKAGEDFLVQRARLKRPFRASPMLR